MGAGLINRGISPQQEYIPSHQLRADDIATRIGGEIVPQSMGAVTEIRFPRLKASLSMGNYRSNERNDMVDSPNFTFERGMLHNHVHLNECMAILGPDFVTFVQVSEQ